jgi:CheY-like chemotaxis protein
MRTVDVQQTSRRRRAPVVLVVEHDVSCRRAMCEALKLAGYGALEAGDGAEALRLLLADGVPEPLVIVLDLRLPIMSGPELLKLLKGYHRLARIPVVLTSTGPPPYSLDMGTQAGWLPQPFDAERLLTLVIERSRRPEPLTSTGKAAG